MIQKWNPHKGLEFGHGSNPSLIRRRDRWEKMPIGWVYKRMELNEHYSSSDLHDTSPKGRNALHRHVWPVASLRYHEAEKCFPKDERSDVRGRETEVIGVFGLHKPCFVCCQSLLTTPSLLLSAHLHFWCPPASCVLSFSCLISSPLVSASVRARPHL